MADTVVKKIQNAKSTTAAERLTGESFSNAIPWWIETSQVSSRHVCVIAMNLFPVPDFQPYGLGDQERFVTDIKLAATAMKPGERVVVMWKLSNIEGCAEIAFKREMNPNYAKANGVVLE
jgi:hypothetical protein